MGSSRLTRNFLYALFFCSGAAALGYQIAWARMFSTGLGHEMPAVLAIVCAFMAGMGLGAWLFARQISESAHPALWYAGLEFLIGLWAVTSALLIPRSNEWALQLIGVEPSALRHWFIAFTLPCLVILPATAAMGATFAAMERWARAARSGAPSIGAVYAANTAGAVAGTLLTAFWIMPALGLRRTVLALAVVNIVCAGVALFLRTVSAPQPMTASPSSRLLTAVFVSGLLGIGYETVGIRVLSGVLENTIYTFAIVLAVFLLGTSLGATFYQRFHRFRFFSDSSKLVCALATACLIGLWPMFLSGRLYDRLRDALGAGGMGIFASEMLVAIAVFGLPTIAMGVFFSHLVQSAVAFSGGVGRGIAVNTFGAAMAPIVFGVVLLPLIGAKWTLIAIALAYLTLLQNWLASRWALAAVGVVLLTVVLLRWQPVDLPPDSKVVEFRQGVMASVTVLEDTAGHRSLRINNRFQQGGTAAAQAEYRHAHIPLLLHPLPRQALFLGLGTGITLGASTLHPELQAHGVELVPEVLEVMPQFEPYNFSPHNQTNITLSAGDARRFVRAANANYDVIVSDLFHPSLDGAGMLYTVEHFAAIRSRLNTNGLFCQWLPLYQLDEAVLRIIAASFLKVFPNGQAWLLRFNVDAPVLGLIAPGAALERSETWIEDRLKEPSLKEHIQKLALADSVRFFGNLLLDAEALRKFAETAPLNTDDMPHVVFKAGAIHRQSRPYSTLVSLLEISEAEPGTKNLSRFETRLRAYWRARNTYLRGLIAEDQNREAQAFDAFIESARLSPDFTPGYARCITVASLRAKSDPAIARDLLERLAQAQPSQSLAKDMLQRLFGNAQEK